jgi:beta-phosphoglucomutase-like phosphatase (HAD superfamily)
VTARAGVLDLMDEAREKGLLVGVCSAATKSSAICVLESLLGPERFQVCAPTALVRRMTRQ